MSEIELKRRVKYAGDVHAELLKAGWDCCTAAEFLNNIPDADVAQVRHGRWDDEHKCTVCHNEAFYKISNIRPDYDYDWEENLRYSHTETHTEYHLTNYCPNCGAKMDLEG